MNLTTTEAALIDLEKGKEAFMARRKALGDPAVPVVESDAKHWHPWAPDVVDALTRPVQVKFSFDDPIKTRAEIEMFMAALVEAQMVTQDHGRGIVRQRMDLRNIIKTAAKVLTRMQGKEPRD
jgi:hypothetical protein